MSNLNQLMRQAQEMQSRLLEAQKKMENFEIFGDSGGGMVTVVIGGKGEAKKITIDPKLMLPEDAEVVGDLIVVAFNNAKEKLEAKMREEMGVMLPPGMKLF
ncbi:MAG: YbaB/EbfC family nucleoid-associated protein [Holosporaceae bacterium]|jgi:DNA-binding YbaB/EbfC family protein|nr:YbaB/EbfC family nucleoid-associated protein [Holosporaceae bacterium]